MMLQYIVRNVTVQHLVRQVAAGQAGKVSDVRILDQDDAAQAS